MYTMYSLQHIYFFFLAQNHSQYQLDQYGNQPAMYQEYYAHHSSHVPPIATGGVRYNPLAAKSELGSSYGGVRSSGRGTSPVSQEAVSHCVVPGCNKLFSPQTQYEAPCAKQTFYQRA